MKDELIENHRKELEELEKIIEKAQSSLKNAPEGSLRISKKKNTVQYYWRTDPKDTHGKYIKKSQQKLIQQLAQKNYDKKILEIAYKNKDIMKKFLSVYHPEGFVEIYEKIPYYKRKFIKPYVLPNELYIELWKRREQEEKDQYQKNNLYFQVGDSGILTENGEYVRSKSEKILADKLYSMNIPYVYEVPLLIKGYGYIKPDFKVLNKRTRKEYYWEHLGMMGDTDYCEKAIKKIEAYEKNQIYQGEKLILTYETQTHPISIKVIENLIQKFLL